MAIVQLLSGKITVAVRKDRKGMAALDRSEVEDVYANVNKQMPGGRAKCAAVLRKLGAPNGKRLSSMTDA